MAKPALVIMAAGMGRRYGGLKQLDGVGPGGETVTDYCVYDALRAGFGKVVFVIRREMESAFRERIGRMIEAQVETRYVFQEVDSLPAGVRVPAGRRKPWGTAHAVLCGKEAMAEPFAAINADDYYGPDSYTVLCDYLRNAEDGPEGYDYCMTGFVLKNTLSPHGHVARGVCEVDGEGLLVEVTERTKIRRFDDGVKYAEDAGEWVRLSAESIASMNMWGFTLSVFNELEARFARFVEEQGADLEAEFFMPEVVGELVREGKARVRVLHTDENWFGVTYREDVTSFRAAMARKIEERVYPERLWERRLFEGS